MDGQEYLNQISAQARPVKKSKMGGAAGGLFDSPIAKVIAVGLGLFVVVAIIGGILGNGGDAVKKQATELLLHINNTTTAISDYQSKLKSSKLRSNSASLDSVLSNTSRDLNAYMVEKYNYKPRQVNKDWTAAAALHQEELTNDLFYAKINGILDRIYAHKMAYEISLITGRESSLYAATNNDALRELLQKSYDSLENLYELFNNFSETR